jgi:MFS family permease
LKSRNVVILSIATALGRAAAPLTLLVGGIIGAELAPSPALATASVTIGILGVAIFTIPAALVMKRVGRKAGFIGATLVAAVGALLAAYAIAAGNFALFCAAMVLLGANLAFVQQYRFAAAESVEGPQVGKAVSFVLLGGVAAGYLGPEIANRTKDWLDYGLYTGSFVALAALYLVVAVLLVFMREVAPPEESAGGAGRPLRAVIAQPTYLVAVVAGVVSYGVMSFMMTATPVSMHVMDGYTLEQTGWVIQSHAIAMYLPALVTGLVIERLGVLRVMGVGVFTLFACVLLAAIDRTLMHYWGALVLLGVGWNFLFVGGTVLLTRSYYPSERFQAQAVNDFLIFGVQAFTSLAAGAVIYYAGWEVLSLLTLPFLVMLLAAIAALGRYLARPAGGELAAVAD